jgi:hypothetical protein
MMIAAWQSAMDRPPLPDAVKNEMLLVNPQGKMDQVCNACCANKGMRLAMLPGQSAESSVQVVPRWQEEPGCATSCCMQLSGAFLAWSDQDASPLTLPCIHTALLAVDVSRAYATPWAALPDHIAWHIDALTQLRHHANSSGGSIAILVCTYS